MTTILILTGSVGLFLIGMGLAENFWRHPKTGQGLAGLELPGKTPLTRAPRQAFSLRSSVEALLYQARAPISPAEFLAASAGAGFLLAVGIFWITGGYLLALAMFPLGASLYYLYLTVRREKGSRQYEEVQPQVVYALYFYLKSHGLDVLGALKHIAQTGPEIVRTDWLTLAAAVQGAEVNAESINRLLTVRASPGFTRLVEALLLFRSEKSGQLPQVLEDLRRDISLEVEIARESTTAIFGARRQLLLVALMPVALSLFFVAAMPPFRDFYASVLGQILLLGMYLFSGAVYVFGSRAAAKAGSVRPYTFTLPENRPASFYRWMDTGRADGEWPAWETQPFTTREGDSQT